MIDNFVAIVPAAGRGKRLNIEIPKQFLKIGDRTILELSLKPLLDFSECLKICVVLAPNDEHHKSIELLQNPLVSLINGGNTRMESVKAAINHFERTKLPYKNVLIHDAVRPCLRSSDLRLLLESQSISKVDGLVLGSLCSNTIKEVKEKNLKVIKTLDRRKLWNAFTPQIFKKEALSSALENNLLQGRIFTDEASLVEANNGILKMIEGTSDNIKITFPEDINLAKSILISQGRMEKDK